MSDIKSDIRTTRAATARIRTATNALPKMIAAEAFNFDSDKEGLINLLNEIIGCAAVIAEVAEVDL